MVFLVWLQARPEPDGQKPEMIIVDDVLLVVVSYVCLCALVLKNGRPKT